MIKDVEDGGAVVVLTAAEVNVLRAALDEFREIGGGLDDTPAAEVAKAVRARLG